MKPRWFQNWSCGFIHEHLPGSLNNQKGLWDWRICFLRETNQLSSSHLTFQIWVFIFGPLFHGVCAFRKLWFQISRSTTSKSTTSLATMVLASWVSGQDGKSKWWPYSCCHPYFQQWWPYSCWGSNNANLCMVILRIISLIVHCLGW